MSPVPSISVAINGAETTAGSILQRFNTIGITDETMALHSVMQTSVRLTISVISIPMPIIQARTQPARPSVAAIINEVLISLRSTRPTSRRWTSPSAMARTSVEVICVPLFPPVPISSGIKNASAMADSSASSKCWITELVYASATNSSSSQTERFFHRLKALVSR
ncbi:Uncharacterised protein [Enterobacter hormaechei]|nr:Uncharacterised protein [Enterobacter hormaechei]